jgi:hypothetical protein
MSGVLLQLPLWSAFLSLALSSCVSTFILLFICAVYMIRYYDREKKSISRFWWIYTFPSRFLEYPLSVYTHMYLLFANSWTVEWIILICDIEEFTHRRSLSSECEYSRSKVRAFHRGPIHTIIFSKMAQIVLITFLWFMVTIFLSETT